VSRPEADASAATASSAFELPWLGGAEGSALTVADAVVAGPLLAVFWVLLGPPGLAVWLAVTVAWAVGAAVVAVAIGTLAIGTLAGTADTLLLGAAAVGLLGILVRDGMNAGWDGRTGVVFAALAAGLGASVLFLEARTSLLVTGLVLCGVLVGGALGLAHLVPGGRVTEDADTYE
jgi:hypothetical protein